MKNLYSDDETCRSSYTTSLDSSSSSEIASLYSSTNSASCRSMIKQQHHMLKMDQASLKHQLNTLQMEISSLKLKSDHLEHNLKKMQEQSAEELRRSQAIKPKLFKGAQRALDAQKPVDFPKAFLTTIFASHADDANFRDHCEQIDMELSKAMIKLGDHAYQVEKDLVKDVVKQKTESLREKLTNKYKAKLMSREEAQLNHRMMLKDQCFQLLKQFIIESSCGEDEQYIKSYLKQLKELYAQESEDP